MKKTLLQLCVLALVLAAASGVRAQELGTRGNLVFSAERLFGFYVDKQNVDPDVGPSFSVSSTDFSLLWNAPPTPMTIPRLGVDYFIDEHWTIGGNLGVFSLSQDRGPGNADATGILFGVRGGYALRLSHGVSFWPRVGFTYTTVNTSGGVAAIGSVGTDRNMFALALEGMFTLAPSESWAFLVGPTVDLGLAGSIAGQDATEYAFGIMCGVGGWLNL